MNEQHFFNEIKKELPHGSGIDDTWGIEICQPRSKYYKLYNSFHCMDENGFYDGWADFTVAIPRNLKQWEEFRIMFNNDFSQYQNRKYHLRDYLEDLFYWWLSHNETFQAMIAESE